MTNHVDLLSELQLLEKVPSLERLRTAQKRRNQQLKKWAQYEKEMQSKKRKADKKKAHNGTARRRVSFATNVVLLEASARNDGNEVRYLLKNGVNPDLCNEDGLTALHQCCIDNYEGIVKTLLNYGANVNPKDNELWTPLHAAATCGHSNLVKLLIQHGADLLAVNSDGNMPYDLCEDDPTLDMIETAMVNQGITQEIINETREAQERLMVADIQEIVQQHQDINQTDEQGVTLLHIAAANGYLRVVEILLEQGAKLDVQDSEGWQPLHAATFWGQVHVAELLVSHGANLMAKSFLDETPIDLCEDEEFRAILLDLKHKHDIIMKSHLKQKTSLCRRTSSTGSRGKVVRRASLSDRNNLYRKEYETEAIVWLGKTETKEADEPERVSDQENTDPNTLPDVWNAKPKETKHDTLTQTEPAMKADSNCQVPCNGTLPKSNLLQEFKSASCSQPVAAPWTACRDGSYQTLAELKRQRVAAKLSGHPLLNGHLSNGDENGPGVAPKSQISTVSSNGSALSYTVSSGEPPLLKLKQPLEVAEEKEGGCCSIS